MKYHLVAGGDSFVYGESCEKQNQQFVNIIATRLFDRSCTNVGIRGASNDMISAAIVAALKNRIAHQRQDEPQKGNVVLVGWTGQMRFEISARNKIDIATSVLDVNPITDKKYRWFPTQNIDRRLLDQLWSASAGYYRFLHAREYLLSFCALHNINVVEFCTLPMYKAELNNSEIWTHCARGATQNDTLVYPLNTDRSLVNLLEKGTSIQEVVLSFREKHKQKLLEQYSEGRLKNTHPTAVEGPVIAEILEPRFNFLYE